MREQIETHDKGHAAINVKFYGRWPDVSGAEILTQAELEQVEESVREQFWSDVTDIAHERGYSGVFSEGRCGGWVVPFYQRTADGKDKFRNWPGQGGHLGYPIYPDVSRIGERSKFLAFQRRVKAMVDSIPLLIRAEIEFQIEQAKEYQASVNA